MPVLLVDGDPVLVSIDQQRLADLGIPSEVVHDNAAGLYGPCGIMRAALVVPEGWQDELPEDLPVQEEWDAQAWEYAQQDSSNEAPEHTRKIGMWEFIPAAFVAMAVLWIANFLIWLLEVLLSLFQRHNDPIMTITALGGIILSAVIGIIALLPASLIVGLLAWLARRLLNERPVTTLITFLLLAVLPLH